MKTIQVGKAEILLVIGSVLVTIIGAPIIWILFNLSFSYAAAYMNTEFAEGYSRTLFSRIEPGDSTKRVEEILGPPIKIFPTTKDNIGRPNDWEDIPDAYFERWEYSFYNTHHSYLVRGLLIDKNDSKVVAKISEAYWD